jgi:3-oxoacyl-[acyl-carrier-protein] synthase-3
MAFLTVKNVSIKGVVSCVPPFIEENISLPFYKEGEAAEVINTTGIERRHVVKNGITASDLCLKAGLELINQLGWEKDSIDAICYVTQTPDYINHPTGFVIHEKMGLSDDCLVLDLFHGCPGWVIGMSSITSMMNSGCLKRVILFDGDSTTPWGYANDRESLPLFGDCGTATAFELDEAASPIYFHIGTKSSDGWALVRKEGAARAPYNRESFEKEMRLREGSLDLEGNADTMDGMSVFSFGITVPPKSIKKVCEYANVDIMSVDKVVIHQANLFMVEKIVKKLKIDPSKAPISLKNYGNVTSASIPLTICSQCHEEYSSGKVKTLVCGFGTGLSWGSAYFETEKIICPEVIIYQEN